MARVMSLTFVVFLTVPILAPSLGQLILAVASWRYIFIVCGVFASAVWLWALLRLPETLHSEYRMTLNRGAHRARGAAGARQPDSLLYTFAMTVLFGSLLAYVGMVQQIFAEVFHRAESHAVDVRAVRGVHGCGGIREFARGGAFRHATDLAHGAAGVHRRGGPARRARPRSGSSRCGLSWCCRP